MAATIEMKKLEEQARKAVADAQSILDAAAKDGRGAEALTPEETKQIDAHMADYDAAKAIIDQVGRVRDAGKAPLNLDDPALRKTAVGNSIMDPPGGEAERKAIINSAFAKALHRTKDTPGIKSLMSEEEYKALTSIVAEDGGLAVSEDMRTQLITKLGDRTHIRARATVITTNKAQVSFPTFDFDPAMDVVLEGETVTPQNITDILGKVNFTPHKRMPIFRCPEELVDDADFDIVGLLSGVFADRLAEIEEADFLTGDGVKSAYGLLTAPISGADIIGSGTTIAPEDVVALPYALRAVHRANGVYMMHRKAVKEIRLLRTNEQGANTGAMLWQPSFQAGQPATLNGFPLLESEFFTDAYTGADGDPLILFGDLAQYWIVDRKQLAITQLMEKYIDSGQIGFRLVVRYDGAPVKLEAFTRLNRK